MCKNRIFNGWSGCHVSAALSHEFFCLYLFLSLCLVFTWKLLACLREIWCCACLIRCCFFVHVWVICFCVCIRNCICLFSRESSFAFNLIAWVMLFQCLFCRCTCNCIPVTLLEPMAMLMLFASIFPGLLLLFLFCFCVFVWLFWLVTLLCFSFSFFFAKGCLLAIAFVLFNSVVSRRRGLEMGWCRVSLLKILFFWFNDLRIALTTCLCAWDLNQMSVCCFIL